MLNKVFLHKDDLVTIQQFMTAFPDVETVEITYDTSSGIGAITTATLNHIEVNGMRVSINKTIVDETSW